MEYDNDSDDCSDYERMQTEPYSGGKDGASYCKTMDLEIRSHHKLPSNEDALATEDDSIDSMIDFFHPDTGAET